MQASPAQIVCPACQRIYYTETPHVGAEVDCVCGQVIPAPGPSSAEGSTRLRPCIRCLGLMPGEDGVCPHCRYDHQTGRTAPLPEEQSAPAEPPSAAERYRIGGVDAFKHRELPIAMIALGLVIVFVVHLVQVGFSELGSLLFSLVVLTGVRVGWMLTALAVMELLLNQEGEPAAIQALKLTAIALVLKAAQVLLELIYPGLGMIMSYGFTPLLWLVMVMWFFDTGFLTALPLMGIACVMNMVIVRGVIIAKLVGTI